FHGEAAAREAHKGAGNKFKWGEMPEQMPEFELQADDPAGLPLPSVVQQAGLTDTTGRARDMMKQAAVRVDGEAVTVLHVRLRPGATYVCQDGKEKDARVTIKQ